MSCVYSSVKVKDLGLLVKWSLSLPCPGLAQLSTLPAMPHAVLGLSSPSLLYPVPTLLPLGSAGAWRVARGLEWRARLGEDVVAVSPSFHQHTSLSITRSLTCSVSHLLSVSQNSSSWSPYFVQSIGSLSSYFPYLPRLSCVAGHEQSDHTNPQLVGVLLFCSTIWRLPSLTVDLLCCHKKKWDNQVIALNFLLPIHKLYPQCPLSWPPFLSLKGFTLQV